MLPFIGTLSSPHHSSPLENSDLFIFTVLSFGKYYTYVIILCAFSVSIDIIGLKSAIWFFVLFPLFLSVSFSCLPMGYLNTF